MDTPFPYNRYVTGRDFTGRRNERTVLQNLISQGEHVALYEPENTGKMSLVQQVLLDMRLSGKQFAVARVQMMQVRSVAAFLKVFAESAIKAVTSSPAEYQQIVETCLAGTHFVFDKEEFAAKGHILSLNWDIDAQDEEAVLRLPQALSRRGMPLVVVFEEFQNIMRCGDPGESLVRSFDKMLAGQKQSAENGCTCIFMGSEVNAMKEIFEKRHFFYRTVQRLPLSDITERDIIDYVVRGFMTSGKVVEKELLLGMCKLFRNNIWYINTFISICDSLSKGYISEQILVEALKSIIAVHEPRFMMIMNDLTTFQGNMLRAILEGNKKFSSTGVIRHYGLSSSANVKRLKDALCKKEIVTFNDKDEPVLLDPLFEYWAKKYYYEIE
ncbi:MAG: hypothetical protein ACI4AE_07000 [Candidatus Cryptobacteroides sp.]